MNRYTVFTLVGLGIGFCACQKPNIDFQTALPDKLDQYLTYLQDKKAFHGAVLVAKDGVVLLQKGFGKASDTKNLSINAQTVLETGSVTKQFTAAAIMQLVDRKKLSVSDKISQFFSNVPTDKADISLHQLLTHTAGLPPDFAGDLDPLTREQALTRIFGLKLDARPGQRYNYSNTGYALLGMVIEQISGQSYFQYMREQIFTPAGLTSTGFYGDDYRGNLYFTGYFNDKATDYTTLNASVYYGNTLANGGVLSTVGDLYRWCTQITGSFLTTTSKTALFTDYGSQYGYGWEVSSNTYGRYFTHNGGGLGGNAYVIIYPDRQMTIIVLSNRITYREAFGVPISVSLPADEVGKQLMENIMTNDFSILPKRTLPSSRW